MYKSAVTVSYLSEVTSSLKGNDKLILSYTSRTRIPETNLEILYYYLYNEDTHEYSYTKFTREVETGNYKELNSTYNYSIPVSSLNGGNIISYTEKVSPEDGGLNLINIRLDDNKLYTIGVYNGSKGETGRKGFTGPQGDKGPSAQLSNPNEGTLIKITNDTTLNDNSYIISSHMGYMLNQKIDKLKEFIMQEEDYQNLNSKIEDTNYFTFEEAGDIVSNKVYKISEDTSLFEN